MNWTINTIGFPALLSVVLSLVFKTFGQIQSKWKAHIAVLVGGGLGLCLLLYNGGPWNPKQIIDAFIYGFMQGAASVGLYEMTKTYIHPRG